MQSPFGRAVERRLVLSGAEPPGDVDEPEVGDDGAAVLQKDVLALQVFVHDAAVVKVAHA